MRTIEKILLVEDDRDDQAIFQMALEEMTQDIHFEIAENGKEAISKLESFQPDVIISDMNMPVMNGPQLLVELRKIGSKLPVVVYSTSNTDREILSILGAVYFFLKPDTISALKEEIQRVVTWAF